MKYTVDYFRISSDWFTTGKNKFQSIDKDRGLKLYFNLFKFRVHQGDFNNHLFITSLYHLKKELGWNIQQTFDTLTLLKKNKIISIKRYDWNLLTKDNKINDKMCLNITAIDVPQKEDNYIYIPVNIIEEYERLSLSYKCISFYCLASKWSNAESGFYMSINKISETLGYDPKTINKILIDLNYHQLMFTIKEKNKRGGYNFIHYVVKELKNREEMSKMYKCESKKFIDGVEKRRMKKKEYKSK